MKIKLLIATKNPGKLAELSSFLSELPLEIVSLNDIGINDDVEEDGKTYKENSVKKALYYSRLSGLTTVADDGGLEIAALNGEPGVKSRRWLGEEMSDEALFDHMVKVARDLPDNNRKASFKVVLTLALPNGKTWSVEGKVDGIIAKEPFKKVLQGYPYRSFFFLPKLNKYYHESELSEAEKKLYNHRYRSITKLKPIIIKELRLTIND